MFLKQISIFGFKSFGQKVVLDLPEGLTAIVGPNGCGKSNIFEAMQWALGEQNPYLLRAKNMEELIFNGTSKIKPLSLAEASLTFVNQYKTLPIDFEEVTITRRLFRSGESEYLINKTPCRLKDITHLFLDTGLGKQAYSVLEQSRVDFIINAKPEQRRSIFEEAAGITRYKVRKQEAILKLNSTEQNLLRINDLMTEIEAQRDSLSRQAKRAQRYQELKKQLQEAEITLYLHDFQILNQNFQSSYAEIKLLTEESNGLKEELKLMEESIEDNRTHLRLNQEEITQIQSSIFKIKEAIQRYYSQILKQKEQNAYFDSQMSYLEQQIQTTKLKMEKTRLEMETESINKQQLEARLVIDKDELQKIEAELTELTKEKELMEHKQEENKIDLIDHLNHLAQARNKLSSFEVEVKNIELRIQRIKNEEAALAKKDEGVEKQLLSLSGQIEKKEDDLLELEKTIKQAQEERTLRQNELSSLDNQISHLREDLKGATSKFQTLQKLQQDMEGYLPGVKTLLKANLPGLEGIVADLFESPSRYELAIEAALSHYLQAVVVQTTSQAKEAIKHLKGHKAERVIFLPLDSLKIASPRRLDHPGLTLSLDIVKYEPRYKLVMEYLLSSVVVVETLEEAVELIKRSPLYLRVVTLSGELIDSSGLITGGAPKREGLGLISRKRDLTSLTSQIQMLQEKKPALEGKREETQKTLISLTSKLTEAQGRLHHDQIKLAALKKDVTQLNQFKEDYLRQISLLSEEKIELEKEVDIIKTEMTNLQGTEEKLKLAHSQIEQGIAQLQKELELRAKGIKEKALIVNQHRVSYAQNLQKQEGLNIHLARLKTNLSEVEGEINRFQEQQKQLSSQKTQQHDQSALFQTKIDELEKEKAAEEQGLSLLKGQAQAKDELIRSQEKELKEKREQLEGIRNKSHHLELKTSELKLQMDNIQQQLAREYQMEIEGQLSERKDISRPQILEKINQLKARLEGIGQVNLLAPSEYEILKKRFEFMENQRQDLISAKKDLEELICQIENTSHQLFQETFTAIKSNFA